MSLDQCFLLTLPVWFQLMELSKYIHTTHTYNKNIKQNRIKYLIVLTLCMPPQFNLIMLHFLQSMAYEIIFLRFSDYEHFSIIKRSKMFTTHIIKILFLISVMLRFSLKKEHYTLIKCIEKFTRYISYT